MVAVESRRPEPPRAKLRAGEANGEASAKPAEAGEGTRRVIDRLAALSVPVLLGALGIVLWSMLGDVAAGVDANRGAIAELQTAVENLAVTISERTANRWTAMQEEQQQLIQALVDTAQNEELIEAKTELREHRARLEAMAIELAIGARRLEEVEGAVGE